MSSPVDLDPAVRKTGAMALGLVWFLFLFYLVSGNSRPRATLAAGHGSSRV